MNHMYEESKLLDSNRNWDEPAKAGSISAGGVMRDQDVRSALRALLDEQHGSDPDTTIVEEMGVWSGTVRIDVAVINGELTGFELKSERDTLARLPTQAEIYGLVFDRMYLVTTDKHFQKAQHVVPNWWGALVVRSLPDGRYHIVRKRRGRRNPSLDPLIVAKLLWKDEALALLDRHGLARGLRSKPAPQVHQFLAISLSLEELRAGVRAALKARRNWLGQVGSDPLDVPIDSDADPVLEVAGRCSSSDLIDQVICPTSGDRMPVGVSLDGGRMAA
jgi:hypothetical protein